MPTHVRAFRAVLATLAVVAGIIVTDALAAGGDSLMSRMRPGAYDATGRVDDRTTLLLMLGYTAVAVIAGGWTAARVGAHRAAAVVFGVIMLLGSFVVAIVLWDTAPTWYHIAALVLVLPAATLGGRIAA